MIIIRVIEPHALLRIGILQSLADIGTECKVETVEFPGPGSGSAQECNLLLLSIDSARNIHTAIDSVVSAYKPKALLLLSSHEELLSTAAELPPVVSGCISRHVTPEVLHASVKLVLAGGTCFSSPYGTSRPTLTFSRAASPDNQMDREPSHADKFNLDAEHRLLGLTPRQYEVLVLLARGHPMKTIGRLLDISVATAKAHTETLYQRLGVHNRNAAVYTAVTRGATLGWPSSNEMEEAIPTMLGARVRPHMSGASAR
ncbi:response regulator transcription factor [Allopusillimonas soli]|uniref:Response regulator transcription factor n=1 Tax=Allopusillimonas soli TaxID=659016 RepID=A0A853FDC2_9BURK|nr:response regulator transcription factor [Allopusillimonas soli]NYT36850.1 response regulator transcription factor [Allopusillimonas soli]TEA75310.1 response regulator transcription factor [Allopusillimonas soli]